MSKLRFAKTIPCGRFFPLDVPQTHIPNDIVEPVPNKKLSFAPQAFRHLLNVLAGVLSELHLAISQWPTLRAVLLQTPDNAVILHVICKSEYSREYWFTYFQADLSSDDVKSETLPSRITNIDKDIERVHDVILALLLFSHQLTQVL